MMVYTNLMVAQDFKSFISTAVLKILEEMWNVRQTFGNIVSSFQVCTVFGFLTSPAIQFSHGSRKSRALLLKAIRKQILL